jgi:hypothetical protein
MSDQLTGLVRTVCQGAIGVFATWVLKTYAITIDTDGLGLIVIPIAIGITRQAIMWLEKNVDRRFGWLFGVAKAPRYAGGGLK